MSKAVLVMDMPESCDICDFVDDDRQDTEKKHCILMESRKENHICV